MTTAECIAFLQEQAERFKTVSPLDGAELYTSTSLGFLASASEIERLQSENEALKRAGRDFARVAIEGGSLPIG